MSDQTADLWTSCDTDGCDEPTPWDMAAIVFDDTTFCSPECAREHLDEMDFPPQSIALHDPQFHLDRDDLPAAVGDEDVNIERPVVDLDDARDALDEIKSMYSHDFR